MAVSPVAAVRSRLIANSAVTALVGGRVYFATAPQNATMPYLVLTIIFQDQFRQLSGLSGLTDTDIQVDIFAESPVTMYDVKEAVKLALDNVNGESQSTPSGNLWLQRISYDRGTAAASEYREGQASAPYVFSAEFRVTAKEATA